VQSVAICYRLFDEDGLARGEADHCDIHPDMGQRDVQLMYALSEGTRDVVSEGKKPDSDRATVSLRITTQALAPLPSLSIGGLVSARRMGRGHPSRQRPAGARTTAEFDA
jgi:hypothetical protein